MVNSVGRISEFQTAIMLAVINCFIQNFTCQVPVVC